MGEKKNKQKNGGTSHTLKMHVIDNMTIEVRERFAHQANAAMDELNASGGEPNAWLRQQFSREVVFGIWQDTRELGNIGVALLKGKGRYMLVDQGARAHMASAAFMRCRNIEEAEAMCLTFGDGRQQAALAPSIVDR